MPIPAFTQLMGAHPAAGGGSFTDPTSLPNLVQWLDASDSATTSAITDKSGNGYSMSGTANDLGTQNGLNCLHFLASSSNYMNSTSFSLTGNTATLVYVGNVNWNRNLSMVGSGGSDNTGTDGLQWADPSDGTHYDNAQIFSTSYWPTSGVHLWVMTRNGANWTLRKDGVQVATATTVTTGFAATILGINCIAGTAGSYHGNAYPFCETVIYSDEKTGTDLSNLESYERTKWGTP